MAEGASPGSGLTFLVCGGGNGAHAFAGVAASRGAKVHVYTPLQDEVDKWNAGSLSMTCHYAADGSSHTSSPALVTADPKLASEGVDVAIVVLPASLHDRMLLDVGPHLPKGSAIGTIEGAWWGRPPLGDGTLEEVTFYGIQTLPWAARIKEYGKSVDILGTKTGVPVASSPMDKVKDVADKLQRIVGTGFPTSANLLSLFALDASAIIHPGVMYGKLADWDGEPFDEAPLFYQGIDAHTADVMQAMDAEVIQLKDKLVELFPTLDLSDVVPTLMWLQTSYEDQIADKSTFQSSFNTNASYKGLRFPVTEAPGAPGKLVYLFDYRYLTGDVPYGIVVMKGIAEILGIPTPMLDRAISWAQEKLGKEWLVGDKLTGKDLGESRAPQRFEIHTLEDFMKGAGA
eukprot:CAMPEP_0197900732 /NCGR_PEP_ID=MMETSP1439-20131203/49752_1 /TAXON_ID=66791 /ORGANISM="Gonyaulax spinifera, Strain CCMP409" /LENGTH=400 /DNA_ID=CAMNT_0043521649 /DNA_START=82 /DNA_END=1284 /DNA_ORIENTATION=+